MRETIIAVVGLALTIIVSIICFAVIFGGEGPEKHWMLTGEETEDKL
jgi:hypothetical protein